MLLDEFYHLIELCFCLILVTNISYQLREDRGQLVLLSKVISSLLLIFFIFINIIKYIHFYSNLKLPQLFLLNFEIGF